MKADFNQRVSALLHWKPQRDIAVIRTIDAHTAGEPLRVIIDGLPEIKGDTILAKRKYLKENHDLLRTALMWEPRGHADMYGCILTPPCTKEADFGVLFLHNEGYSSMCGHGIIAITKVVLETGLFEMKAPLTTLRIDAPAGLITAHARIEGNQVKSVFFHNVPSFVYRSQQIAEVPGLGKIKYDIAFGGAFYAYVKAEDAMVHMTEKDFRELIDKGMAIKETVMKTCEILHPFEPDLGFLYGTIFYGPGISPGTDSRNVCIFAEGEVDRSPTGTGVSGRMALAYANREIAINKSWVIESIISSSFRCSVKEATQFGPYPAVIPEVEGTASICGKNEFYLDEHDPFKYGFMLR